MPLTPTPALSAKLARLEMLRSENEADHRPSFTALLDVESAARVCPVSRGPHMTGSTG